MTPLRVAVVGSGPSGFYTAGHLLSRDDVEVAVDMYDRLPTPFGLVRAGVAPDHPKIKSVTKVFDKTAGHERFRYLGNVTVGDDVTTGELRQWYDAVVYAVGCNRGRRLDIVGADLPGNYSAAEFVGWYNGHPDNADLEVDLSARRAVVIGNGNVALDVARMLVAPVAELATTDLADHSLTALRNSCVREVHVVGRRGPVEAAFTHPELLELGELEGVDVIVDPLDLPAPDEETEASLTPTARSNLATLREYSTRTASGAERRVLLRFLASPLAIDGADVVTGVLLGRNVLVGGSAAPTGESTRLEAELVIHAVGYSGTPLPGLPFDESHGTVRHEAGRVLGDPGQYVVGWIKRGPSGVIGTNRPCAVETAEALLADATAGLLNRSGTLSADEINELLRDRAAATSFDDWRVIDAHEREAGAVEGRPRVKLVDVDAMHAVVRAASAFA